MFHIKSNSDYEQQYQASITNPEKFWNEIASNFFWFKRPEKIMDCDLSKAQIRWFEDGKTNLAYNCLDRHLTQHSDKVAIIWEGDDPNGQKITYRELHEQTCQFANFLISRGIKKGDRICIYMPMIPQGIIAMLACARIGAIHSVVFAGFSAKALAGRMQDCGAKMLITSDLLFRGEKKIELFEIAKEAIAECESVKEIVVYKRKQETEGERQCLIWQDEVGKFPTTHEAEICDAEDPLFILYTSGSTGKPKGILHTIGGYMVYAGYSFQNVFQYRQNEIFFCSADIGWITGHTYLAYGPLLNAATILMFEGIPTHPTPARFWQIIEKHRVNIFYTAPTAIRALMQKGDEFVKGHDLSSLRILGTVGEPINHEAWQWYFEKIGNKKCPIADTWWQTETGGIMISSLAGIVDSKPAHAGVPLPGIVPILLDDSGKEIVEAGKVGNLCFTQPWPAMARDIWNDHKKFLTYFAKHESRGTKHEARGTKHDHYIAGDGAFKSEDGFYRIIGRTDDVIKVSGHRLGTAEIENAINSHEAVSESAVVGVPHQIKGEGIYAFVILKKILKQVQDDRDICHPELVSGSTKFEIVELIKKEIGPIAKPEKIYIVPDLPKTRSGKIMRRILKKIITGDKDLGDVSTLVNPDVVEQLKKIL
ncbi:MAG: acetate--CoA ligase [Alphaproteobacteria bacterium RIFCSPLOWO2_01_FULL_40_26]|nr:MAG: acetate--CoA ligase [Alphaproteobacteria bacterium RIFCSPHIGHO2_02_FULL_40_34]OFW95099.1 MAG: acetate--CoA ligase [Alphaproteobacteria bacterium RIFCSPLOWO2_01_FULL_40_26]OFX09078.1 MAG: acetate--CoA ligase [Alphaproteobacteria bacterium RIFCSPLOWO2_02_FULL_40_19]OFX10701.1 MAG: acetate--CoA ligase [Alphaproteobacteria bacterium RIFCSPLOWO2_12_FULL_40_11]